MSRIVFINRFFAPDHSASSQILSDLAFGLAAKGVEVHVVTSRLYYEAAVKVLPASEVLHGVVVHRVWTSNFGRQELVGRALDYVSFYLFAFLRLLAVLRRGDVAVAMTDPPMVSVIAALAVIIRRARLVNWLQDVFPEIAARLGYPLVGGVLGRAMAVVRDWSLRRARLNVVLSDQMSAVARARPGCSERVRVIQNWSDGVAIRPLAATDNELRKSWGLQNRFVVGYSGNLGRPHDAATLLDAAVLLRNEDDIRFVYVGGGSRRGSLERRAAELGLRNVEFRGYERRDLLGQSLTLFDVHVVTLFPAVEGLVVPSKFYGVAAAGRPTIYVGSQDGSIASFIKAAECGEVVAPGDAAALADVIRDWSRDPARVALMGARAREWFDRYGDVELAIDAWDAVLEDVMQTPALLAREAAIRDAKLREPTRL